MVNLQKYARSLFRIRNRLRYRISNGETNSQGLSGSRNSEKSNRALHRIHKKIRRSKLKETIELFSEILLILLVIILLLISLYFFFRFEPGAF